MLLVRILFFFYFYVVFEKLTHIERGHRIQIKNATSFEIYFSTSFMELVFCQQTYWTYTVLYVYNISILLVFC